MPNSESNMTYAEAKERVMATPQFSTNATLARIKQLLAELGNPERALHIVHVAGTNGKGSTTAMLASVLQSAGYRTGAFFSPYVVTFRERIAVDCTLISRDAFARLAARVLAIADQQDDAPNFFEIITAIALLYFAECKCDFVVLETGLGGRLDATNAIPTPVLAILTPISLDHMQYLGETIAQIAAEKCGIIKLGSVVVSATQTEDAMQVISETCRERSCTLRIPALAEAVHCSITGSTFSYKGLPVSIGLLGRHQIENAVTVLEAVFALRALGYTISDAALTRGLADAVLPARLEVLSTSPLCILDGAHNLAGITALTGFLNEFLSDRRIITVFGAMQDKAHGEMVRQIAAVSSAMVLTQPSSPRSCTPKSLCQEAEAFCPQVLCVSDVMEALHTARTLVAKDDVLLICGSLYLASDYKRLEK